MTLSAVILAKNEEGNIKQAIESVRFADEIIVVDDFSVDGTVNLAKRLGAKVFRRHLNGNFAEQRNYGLQKTHGEWILFLDSDEQLTPKLKQRILSLNDPYDGFYLFRKNYFLGKPVGRDRILRLAKSGSGKWARAVHEKWKVKGKIGKLGGEIIHKEGTLRQVIAKTNLYSTIHARENAREGKTSNLLKIVLFPKAKFVQNVLTGKGFVFGIIHSFHSYLAWSKLWLLQNHSARNQ